MAVATCHPESSATAVRIARLASGKNTTPINPPAPAAHASHASQRGLVAS
jgi:hypothetical protein